VKHGPILCFGLVLAFSVGVCLNPTPSAAQASPKQASGILSGVVRDSSGTPQLGATVEVLSELPGVFAARHFLTNTEGVFRGENLAPGVYTVRVTLAGFLPVLERHVKIASNLTTVVRIELESMFASIEQLRRPPVNGAAEAEDWKWVLRSSSGLRPILQWHEEETDTTSAVVLDTVSARPLARIEVTGGARRPGSISNVTGAPGTEFAYDQRVDNSNHIVFAGQVSYDGDAPAGGLAAVWLPTGSLENGPQSIIALREARIGPDGPVFRGVRLDQSGSLPFGDRYLLRVGGEYDLVGLRSSAWSLKPRLSLETKISPNWYVDLVYASLPTGASTNNNPVAELTGSESTNVLSSAMSQLDAFPALLWHAGKPVLENGMHEELAVERKLGPHSLVQVAGFHDDNSHVALFVKGYDLPAAEYFQDFYSKGFAYDGGSSVSWGARVALRERVTDDLELTTIYAWSGALVPNGIVGEALRDMLRTSTLHSAAAKITARVPKAGTRFTTGYKWVSGPAVSRVDPYGEGIYDVSPYLFVGIRQPLPRFALGRWEANAECDNLLAQGYVPLSTRDGQIMLVPAYRSFRGGLSLQF
jgi:hypothetical protein